MSISPLQSAINNSLVAPSVLAPIGSQSSANSPLANLNLTSTQSTQIQNIFQNAQTQGLSFSQVQSQVSAVLTPAQQTTLQGDLKAAGHHHHKGGGGSSSATSAIDSDTDAFGISTDPDANDPTSLLTQLTNPFSSIAAQITAQSQFQAIPS